MFIWYAHNKFCALRGNDCMFFQTGTFRNGGWGYGYNIKGQTAHVITTLHLYTIYI